MSCDSGRSNGALIGDPSRSCPAQQLQRLAQQQRDLDTSGAVQLLLGHADLSHTTVYLHLSRRHLQAAPNPLEQLRVAQPVVLPRSRLLRKPPQS